MTRPSRSLAKRGTVCESFRGAREFRSRDSMHVRAQPIDHGLRNETDTPVGAPKPPRVQVWIFTNDESVWNTNPAIYNDIGQTAVSTHIDVGKDHGTFQRYV